MLSIKTEANSTEQSEFLKCFKQQHAQRETMQRQLANLGVRLTVGRITTDFCDEVVLENGHDAFEVGVTVQIRLDLDRFGNCHENVGYGNVIHESKKIALLQAKHLATNDAVGRGMRMFNEGGNQLDIYARSR